MQVEVNHKKVKSKLIEEKSFQTLPKQLTDILEIKYVGMHLVSYNFGLKLEQHWYIFYNILTN